MAATRWRVAIVGPGGVGGLVGAVLARAGHTVTYVARPQTADALNERGITVRSGQYGTFSVPARASSHLADPVDLCVLATKATNLDEALTGVPASVLGDAILLPLLNGVEHMAALRARYPDAHAVAGVARVESVRVAPGEIDHLSPFCRLEIAADRMPAGRLDALAGVLRDADLAGDIWPDEATLLWDKLAFLAPLALLTTHERGTAGVVRTQRRADLEAMIAEAVAVASAGGGRVDPARVLKIFDAVPPAMKSSMQRDAEAGRPIELDAIGAAVVRAGERHGIPTPVTARLVAQLSGMA